MQALLPIDIERRIRYATYIVQMIRMRHDFLRLVCFTDESIFTSRGVVNKQVHRHWHRKGENEHNLYIVDHQHRWSLMVWAGIVGDRIIGPFFFEGNLTGPRYSEFLQDIIPNVFEDVPINRNRIWWQQDGASVHNTVGTTNFLNQQFGNHWFGLRGPHRWPTRSPDLTPLDTFLWAHLKNECYKTVATTRDNMMERVRQACARITVPMLVNVRLNLAKRINQVLIQNGRHIEHRIRRGHRRP